MNTSLENRDTPEFRVLVLVPGLILFRVRCDNPIENACIGQSNTRIIQTVTPLFRVPISVFPWSTVIKTLKHLSEIALAVKATKNCNF